MTKRTNSGKMPRNINLIFISPVMVVQKTCNQRVSKMIRSMIQEKLFINRINWRTRLSRRIGSKKTLMILFRKRMLLQIILYLRGRSMTTRYREAILQVINRTLPIQCKKTLDHQNPWVTCLMAPTKDGVDLQSPRKRKETNPLRL